MNLHAMTCEISDCQEEAVRMVKGKILCLEHVIGWVERVLDTQK